MKISSRFSEAEASELPENRGEMFPRYLNKGVGHEQITIEFMNPPPFSYKG